MILRKQPGRYKETYKNEEKVVASGGCNYGKFYLRQGMKGEDPMRRPREESTSHGI
jgi:hypothetical protein